jgi:hypothetical protein
MESIRKREGNDGKNKWGLFMKGLECLTDFKFPTVVNKESACWFQSREGSGLIGNLEISSEKNI